MCQPGAQWREPGSRWRLDQRGRGQRVIPVLSSWKWAQGHSVRSQRMCPPSRQWQSLEESLGNTPRGGCCLLS